MLENVVTALGDNTEAVASLNAFIEESTTGKKRVTALEVELSDAIDRRKNLHKIVSDATGLTDITQEALTSFAANADNGLRLEIEKVKTKLTDSENKNSDLTSKYDDLEKTNKINTLAVANGIKEVEYFKYEYDKASKAEGFDEKVFVDNLLETKGGILTGVSTTSINNPKHINNNTDVKTITMSEYAVLGSSERQKYKSNQIIKD